MPTTARSIRQEQRELTARLRDTQSTWSEVAAAYCERYGVNMRAALRMARDWSQRDAADEWNRRWPDDPKTFKNFSYWELWPGPTGHAPSLDVLGRLAELYDCSIADLVQDCADFRGRDVAYRDGRRLAQLPRLVQPGSADGDVQDLISQLELMDVHEVARLTAAWSARLVAVASSRSLLFKLSAGLSLAAASRTLADSDTNIELSPSAYASNSQNDLTGIWHSQYVYHSSGRQSDFTGEHYVIARQHDNRLIAQSLRHSTGSRLRLELIVEPPLATGSWREVTAPRGYYKGAAYHGTVQFVIEPNGRTMRGMWLGFSRNFGINTGQWMLEWQDGSITKTTQRRYYEKL